MSTTLQAIRGMNDILPDEADALQAIVALIADKFGEGE